MGRAHLSYANLSRGVRWFWLVLGAVFLAALLLLGVGFYLSPQNALKPVEAIVVISGGDTARRVAAGVSLLREEYAPKLIFSGAAREGKSNAAVMAELASAAGVPREKIYLEERSRNTLENAKFTAALLRQLKVYSIILVTSPYHQRRALTAFRKELGKDFPILNHSAIDENWRKKSWWQNPSTLFFTLAELQKTIFTGLVRR